MVLETKRCQIFRFRNVAVFLAIGVSLAALACSKTQEPVAAPVPPPQVLAPATAPPLNPPPDVPTIYSVGIFEEPDTRNYWNYIAGPVNILPS